MKWQGRDTATAEICHTILKEENCEKKKFTYHRSGRTRTGNASYRL